MRSCTCSTCSKLSFPGRQLFCSSPNQAQSPPDLLGRFANLKSARLFYDLFFGSAHIGLNETYFTHVLLWRQSPNAIAYSQAHYRTNSGGTFLQNELRRAGLACANPRADCQSAPHEAALYKTNPVPSANMHFGRGDHAGQYSVEKDPPAGALRRGGLCNPIGKYHTARRKRFGCERHRCADTN